VGAEEADDEDFGDGGGTVGMTLTSPMAFHFLLPVNAPAGIRLRAKR
jgi:hypothetical protein